MVQFTVETSQKAVFQWRFARTPLPELYACALMHPTLGFGSAAIGQPISNSITRKLLFYFFGWAVKNLYNQINTMTSESISSARRAEREKHTLIAEKNEMVRENILISIIIINLFTTYFVYFLCVFLD